jgi:hypothetical protein
VTEPLSRAVALALMALAALVVTAAAAQENDPGGAVTYERDVYALPAHDAEGKAYDHPTLGGLNIPRPQLVDIDDDGDLDLFVQEHSGAVMFFEQVGTATEPHYIWRQDRFQGTDIGEWYVFADMDDDGDFDLLGEELFSKIRYYQNVGTAAEPKFELLTATIMDVEGAPMFSDRQNIPKVADLDCNGRLDLLIGRVEGTIVRYEMTRLDEQGAPVFRYLEDRFQNIEIIGQVLGGSPAGLRQRGVQSAESGSAGSEAAGTRGTFHGANTMALEDFDGDGDLDLFWGDFFEPGVLLIENRGSCRNISMRGPPTPFPRRNPVETSGYNAPAFGNLDGDGDRDMLVGVLGGAFNPNNTTVDNLLMLERGRGQRYDLRTRQFLTQIDVGSESIPAWVDIDGDGDLDLFLANKIEPGDTQAGRLFFFENTGDAANPDLYLRGAVAEFASAYHYAPAFGDLDGDGDYDILMGTWDDELMLVLNEGAASAPVWGEPQTAFVTLTRGRNAQPTLGDIDGDGDLDLFIGESSGEINFYRNTGSPQAPEFELVEDKFQAIDVGRRSSPHLTDFDSDGDLDLLIGSETEGVFLYRNTGSPTEPHFELDESFAPIVAPFSSPELVDIDGDGVPELFTGTVGGGLAAYRARR